MKLRRLPVQISFYWEKFKINHIIGIVLGSFIIAVAIQAILIPVRMLTGGISGISIILQYLFNLNVSLSYAIINIPIFIAGYRFVSKRFVLYSLLGAASLTGFLYLVTFIDWNRFIQLSDPLLAGLFGGIISGLGSGLVFRCQGSTGGTDIIAVLVKKRWGYNIGQTTFFCNIFILCVLLSISNLTIALFTAISIFISGQVLDMVTSGSYVSRTVMIISKKHEEISEAVLRDLRRGCTKIGTHGGYTGDDQELILVTISKTQLPAIKELIFTIDENAFIIINESIEVFGKGFRSSTNSDF